MTTRARTLGDNAGTPAGMKALAVNAGSSSIRLDLFRVQDGAAVRQASHHGARQDAGATDLIEAFLARPECGVPDVVAHRVVHGGEHLSSPCVLDAAVEEQIQLAAGLAPLHNPVALEWISACREALGSEVQQVAVFDTGFFAGLPEAARTYALPREWSAQHGLRRYGFHGLAHAAMWRRWCDANPERGGRGRVISLQLGAGCSVAAIRDGQPLDTSMGFSPLEGLVMATRSGDVDPGLLLYLQRHLHLTPASLEATLNRESGLRGLSGLSGDMHVLLASDDPAARRAVSVYCHRARKYLGAYLAVLGGADAILFGGGVGENAPEIRARLLDDMAWAGIELDALRNDSPASDDGAVHRPESRVGIHVVPVDEAVILAEEAVRLTSVAPVITQTRKGGSHA